MSMIFLMKHKKLHGRQRTVCMWWAKWTLNLHTTTTNLQTVSKQSKEHGKVDGSWCFIHHSFKVFISRVLAWGSYKEYERLGRPDEDKQSKLCKTWNRLLQPLLSGLDSSDLLLVALLVYYHFHVHSALVFITDS